MRRLIRVREGRVVVEGDLTSSEVSCVVVEFSVGNNTVFFHLCIPVICKGTSTVQGLLLGSVPQSSSFHRQLQVSRSLSHLQGPWKPRPHEPAL